MNPETRGSAGAGGLADSVGDIAQNKLATVLWRRKWIALGATVALTVIAALISMSLPKEYEATATLWVTEGQSSGTFDAVQAGQVLADTYAHVADNSQLADQVARSLPFDASGEDVEGSMTFAPVSETQLLRLTATDEKPVRARVEANTYARTFIDYSHTQLGDAVNAEITFAAPAATPSQPARPQPTLYTLGGALLGVALGVMLAFLAELLDRRIKSDEELEQITGVPVLARVPRRTRTVEAELVFDETIRMLRTNLQFLRRGSAPTRSIVVGSPSVGDGKSTISYHLARAFAEAEIDTILIEGDMRRPGLGRNMARRPGGKADGLSDYLAQKADLDAVLQKTDLPSLQFIPSGLMPSSPSAIFNAERARLLLDDAAEHAEMVIIDTPPLSVGAEANTLAASADGVLLVVDAHVSTKAAIRAARQRLSVVGASFLGTVINSVRELPDMGAYAYRDQGEAAINGGAARSSRRSVKPKAPPRA